MKLAFYESIGGIGSAGLLSSGGLESPLSADGRIPQSGLDKSGTNVGIRGLI